jgi:hypothetical protein
MLIRGEKPISKEQYERAQLNNGVITSEDKHEIFDDAMLYGYGVYSPIAFARYDEGTKVTTYWVGYTTSDSCD